MTLLDSLCNCATALHRSDTVAADWRGADAKKRVAKRAKSETLSAAAVVTSSGMTATCTYFSPDECCAQSLSADWLVGAHVSSQGGAAAAPLNAASTGCRSFALFLRQKMSWASKPLSELEPGLFRYARGWYAGGASVNISCCSVAIVRVALFVRFCSHVPASSDNPGSGIAPQVLWYIRLRGLTR